VLKQEVVGEGTDSEEEAVEELRREEENDKDAMRRGEPIVDLGVELDTDGEEEGGEGGQPALCESCNEMGHTVNDCPHRTEREDEDEKEDEDDDEDEEDDDEGSENVD
jgi:hypothetical protein